jgi:hypothetical protein
MLRTIYLTFYGPEYKIYKYIFQLSDIFFVGTRKACHIFIEESNNNYKKPEGDANICPWPTHTHHPTRHLLSQHDSPLPSSRSLPNAELLQHTIYGLLRGKLHAQVPKRNTVFVWSFSVFFAETMLVPILACKNEYPLNMLVELCP